MAIAPPCVMGAQGCNSINANNNFNGANAQSKVVDANGNTVAEPTPTVSLTTAIANVVPEPFPSPAATPQPNGYNLNSTSPSTTSATLTVAYSSTLSASIGVREFNFAGFEWPTIMDRDAAAGYTLSANGTLVPQTTTAGDDIYITKDTDGVTKLFAPGGFQNLGNQPIGTLTSALPFTPSGTTIPISSITTGPTIIVKASTGYIVFKFGVVQCGYSVTLSNCDVSAMTGSIYNTAGVSGTFQ